MKHFITRCEALVEMVREFAIVPEDKILDKFGYKEIYNEALIELVAGRIEKFKRGELDITDFTIKGALEFMDSLRNRGVKLYLASGTDRRDVIAESEALGYAELFEGGIYGAVNNLQGPELAVFGDGPVEIRECRKRDGIAVGIAGDEIRRHGLNPEKRTRLIKAGAQLIVPDFSQHDKLSDLLFQR